MGAQRCARGVHAAQPNAMSAHAEGFPPAHAGAGSAASGQLEELQGFSRHLLAKLDESRNMGQFSQAEIELLRKKLSVVVNAFSAERAKIEGELNTVRVSSRARGPRRGSPVVPPARLPNARRRRVVVIFPRRPPFCARPVALIPPSSSDVSLPAPLRTNASRHDVTSQMAHAYEQDIAERDYAISSAQLELANAKRHIKVLEVQRSALSDDVETARTEYEVLVAQLAEEQDSGDALKRELSSLRRALQQAAHGLSEADAELERTTRQLEEARRDVARAERDAERGASLRAQTTDAQAAATQLARAEAKLEEVMRREAGLEQRLIFEREAKEALEETAARERAAAARAAEDASRVAGEAASLRREVTEQRGAQHELQRLLAERDGSLAVLKAQLADAEGKYASTRAGTEPELRGRLHEVERRAAEMARELGAKGAALQALERQLGERTAEAATERERAERSRHRVRALEAELRAERSRDSSSAGASGGGESGAFASRGDAGRGEKRTSAPPPPRFPAAERKGRQKQKRVAEAETKAVEEKIVDARSEKERAAAKEAAKEKAQAAVAAAAELETSGADGSLGSLFAGDGANAVVVNVLDHLSLSGYVSPLAKEKAAAGAAEPAGVTVGGLNLTPPGTAEKPSGAKARAKRVAAAFESEETASETAIEKRSEARVSELAEAQNEKEGEGFVASEPSSADVADDVSKPPDLTFVDDDASTEEIEAPDSGEEVAPRVTRSAKKATPAKSPAKGETPGKRERGKTPKGKLIGGLRMPLANLGQKKSSDSGSGGAAASRGAAEAGKEKGGERKKRRLLNQQTVGGDEKTHPSLLFGVGSDFAMPKPP